MREKKTTKLVTTFLNGNGKEHNWTYKHIDETLPPQQIKEACELLTTLGLFEKDGIKLFESVVRGKLVTTTERILFDQDIDTEDYSLLEEHCEEVRNVKSTNKDNHDSSRRNDPQIGSGKQKHSGRGTFIIPELSQLPQTPKRLSYSLESDRLRYDSTAKNADLSIVSWNPNIDGISSAAVESTVRKKVVKPMIWWLQKIPPYQQLKV